MKKLFCFLLVLLGCTSHQPPIPEGFAPEPFMAQGRVLGQDYLGLQHPDFNVKQAGKYLDESMATGNLDTSFGESLGPIKKLLNKVASRYHRVHIINTTCVRNNKCGPYEIGYGYSKASFDQAIKNHAPQILNPFKARVKLYEALSHDFIGTEFLLSPALEHDLSTQSYRVLADAVLSVWPGVQLVNSADGGIPVERYKGAWIERHGSTPQADADIVSLDGAEGTDINIKKFLKRTKGAKVVLFWTRLYNGRTNSAVWQDPRDRVAWPTEQHFEEFAHIFDKRPAAPTPHGLNCVIKSFTGKDTWKPLAESGLPYGGKMDYPLVIIPSFAGIAQVLASNGKVVGQLGYLSTYTPYGPDWWRYYSNYGNGSGVQGYEFEKRAMAETGSPHVWLRTKGVGSVCYGPLLTGQRQGTFH